MFHHIAGMAGGQLNKQQKAPSTRGSGRSYSAFLVWATNDHIEAHMLAKDKLWRVKELQIPMAEHHRWTRQPHGNLKAESNYHTRHQHTWLMKKPLGCSTLKENHTCGGAMAKLAYAREGIGDWGWCCCGTLARPAEPLIFVPWNQLWCQNHILVSQYHLAHLGGSMHNSLWLLYSCRHGSHKIFANKF